MYVDWFLPIETSIIYNNTCQHIYSVFDNESDLLLLLEGGRDEWMISDCSTCIHVLNTHILNL